ncbi:ATP-binding protein [Sphingomonas sp. GCM10030256]|uniref:sensor histidine kinase n=1 Tax=Sphingomonas sp. GCM10030256 TaxID=3273427 RepID=UPI00360E9A3D
MPVARIRNGRVLTGDLVAALLAPACAFVAAEIIHSVLALTRLGLLFLAAVTVVASMRGSRAAIFAAIISVVAYKFFLDLRTDEYTTTAEDLLNMTIFLVVALITGALAGKVHDEAAKARQHAERMDLLFRTSRLLAEENQQEFWPVLTDAIARGSGGAAISLDANGAVRAQSGEIGEAAAVIAFGKLTMQAEAASEETNSLSSDGWRARRIPSEAPYAGVLLWKAEAPDSETDDFVDLVADLASASTGRSRIREEQARIAAAEEGGKLREALLSSISHDFRSPLSAIIGSSTSLLEYGDKFEPSVRTDLLLNIRDEGEKLNQFVGNLLNMTRLQSGTVQPNCKSLKVAEVIDAAAERLKRHHESTPRIEVDADCHVMADPLLLEQAVYNVLDNAAKYAPSEDSILVRCTTHDHASEIRIIDHGPGLPEEDQAGVFTAFHFAREKRQVNGTGLGLSISRGFVEAMGGTIEARSRRDGAPGLEVAIMLPRSEP